MVLFFKRDLIEDSVFSSLAFAKRNASSSVLETLEYAFFISVCDKRNEEIFAPLNFFHIFGLHYHHFF